MELKTQALDRLLEALSPALSAELERVTQEIRESLEQEFNQRLQRAVSDAEATAQSNAAADAAADLNGAVAEATERTREATRAEVTEELERQFAQRLAEIRESLEQEFNQRLQRAVSEAEGAAQSNAAADAAADLNRAVAEATERTREATRVEVTEELQRPFVQHLSEIRESREQEFNQRFQRAVSEAEGAAQSNAAADAAADLNGAVAEATEKTREATRAEVTEELERQFAQRLAENTNHVRSEGAAERARLQEQLEQWKVFADIQRQLAESSSQPEILMQFLNLAQPFANALAVYIAKADGLALWKIGGKAAFPDIISHHTTDPESFFRAVTVRGNTVAAVCAAPPFKSEVMEFLSGCLERAIEVFGLKLRTSSPRLRMSEKTLVVSALGSELNPEEQKAHADARRTARLLVSEIKLYHEQELESGRQNNDIYRRLQREIDTGREMYQHRVRSAVFGGHDYFHEELVRILGGNDPGRLGPAYPGPKNS